MDHLNKLQSLCNTSNRRYKADQNDDDQVRALFNYAQKNTSVCVVIGYDEYNATTAEEVVKMYKDNPEAEVKQEKDFSFIKMNYKTYKISTSLLN